MSLPAPPAARAFRGIPSFLGLALASLLAFAAPAAAQTWDVVGRVLDATRGTGLAGVAIRMQDGRLLGTSQSTGRFEITVNNRRAVIVFSREGYQPLQLNLGDLARLVDVDVYLESSVQELDELTAYAPGRSLDPSLAQTIEELEALQGMRMDLNDHLRQIHGVAGMNEYTGDISVHGSRTQDVTHYLGRSRIPSLRHLEFGFPGNQSVLNPRLLRSVTLADNLARGPVNQGNASALVYDLQEGDPEAIRGDVVLGTVNRELNLNAYWGERTFLASGRYLNPNSLGVLGKRFFTTPKDARIDCRRPDDPCRNLEDPLRFSSLDLFLSTFRRDTSGAFGRHTFLAVDDNYEIREDKSLTPAETRPQTLIEGFQGAWLYSWEALRPWESGDLEWGFSYLNRDFHDAYRDTTVAADPLGSPWYPQAGTGMETLLGRSDRQDRQYIVSAQWSPSARMFGAAPSYGIELEHTRQNRRYRDISTGAAFVGSFPLELDRDLTLGSGVYRLRWNLAGGRGLEAAAGAAVALEGWRGDAEQRTLPPLPLASLRYTHPLAEQHKIYAEGAGRHSVTLEPSGLNEISAKATPSVEGKVGGDGLILAPLRYAWSGYTRWYRNPALPHPEVFWNYAETRSADDALVHGANATLTWLPGHHAGLGINASVIQGRYRMSDGGTLPWESNRSLDLVSNLRILPRSDSLFSFIFTYGVHNHAPLYEYRGLWTWETPSSGRSTGERAVYQSTAFPTVSRQRLDARVNLDLKSQWRPLESMRFFFEANNIFAEFEEESWASWLGGRNERRRGWTRANAEGNLEPVVTRGLGLFLMFGIEGKLKI